MKRFATNQFRTNPDYVPPPPSVPDVLIKQNNSSMQNRFQAPFQTNERPFLANNMGLFQSNTPRFHGQPPGAMNQQQYLFSNQGNRPPFQPLPPVIHDQTNRPLDIEQMGNRPPCPPPSVVQDQTNRPVVTEKMVNRHPFPPPPVVHDQTNRPVVIEKMGNIPPFPPPPVVHNQTNRPVVIEKVKVEAISRNGDHDGFDQDRGWLEQWLTKTKHRLKEPEKQTSISLPEIQMKTRHMLVLIAKLQKQKQVLATLKDEDRSIWDQKVQEIERVKTELDQLQSYLSSKDTATKLKKKIVQRKKKRERLKRQRREKYEKHLEELAQREQKHREIDRVLEKIQLKEKDAKQEKDLQKEVDSILGQVKKKITENSRAMQLLQSLEKLRQIRKERQERQGVRMVGLANDNIFNTRVGNLRTVLEKQDKVYKTEESALKVILETEQEETREKERQKERQREMERQKQEAKKAEQALFGTYKEPRPDDPLYPFKQYYDAANNSFEAFLSIRHEWDKFLVLEGTPGGSRIPEDWVIPPEPSSDIWATALQDR